MVLTLTNLDAVRAVEELTFFQLYLQSINVSTAFRFFLILPSLFLSSQVC